MKRVLVLNVDSFVGRHVCRQFYDAKEYLVDGTFYHHQSTTEAPTPPKMEELGATRSQSSGLCGTTEVQFQETNSTGINEVVPTVRLLNGCPPDATVASGADSAAGKESVHHYVNDMRPYLNAVVPRHGEINDEEFRSQLLTYDIIIAVLEENAFEAECAIKILKGTHYNVEKTFVLVSNVFTWAQTDMRELENRRAERRAAREAARLQREQERANREQSTEDGDETEEEEEEEEEEQLEVKVWSDEEYRRRYPDTRYHGWRALEHAVKQANSETLHTYVLWAGLPYGAGEDLLRDHFLSAWRHQPITQYGDGSNYVPTVHVKDLSRIIFLVGSSYDTLEDRYMFVVDQGNNTQKEILDGIRAYIGGEIEVTEPVIDRDKQVVDEIEERKRSEELKRREESINESIKNYMEELDTLAREKAISLKRKRELEEAAKQRSMYKSIMNAKRCTDGEEKINREKEELNSHECAVEGIELKMIYLKMELSQKEFERDLVTEYNRLRSLDQQVREKDKIGLLVKGNVEEYDNKVAAPEIAMADIRLYIDEPHGLGNWFSALNVRCESGAALQLLGESDWVSLGGFVANVDKVVQEFKSERLLCPMRLVIAGPPFGRVPEISRILANLFDVVHLTIEDIIIAFEAHVAKVREQMVTILLRRRARRQAAREERIRRERQRRLLERKERLRAKREAGRGGNGEDDDDDEEGEEEEGEEEENEEEGEEDFEEEESEEGAATQLDDEEGEEGQGIPGGGLVSPSPKLDGDENIIPEHQLLNGQDEEEEDEEESETDSNADTKARQLAQQVDEQERFEIATLREEYRFCTKLLNLRLLNGEFPQIPKSDEEEEEEEEEEEVEVNRRGRRKSKSKTPVNTSPDPPPTIRYFDEALAVMVRWRLRQADCKNQGYILENFPRTVRQARLVFLAYTPEQKEQQRPKLYRNSAERAQPPKPCDFAFPLPSLEELDDGRRREMLNAMDGKSFLQSDDALAPTNDALFPDCFIFIQASRDIADAEVSELKQDIAEGGDHKDPHEELTHFLTNYRLDAPPTESLLSWYQTVVVEKPEEGEDAPAGGGWDGEEPIGGERPPRSASIVFAPMFTPESAVQTDCEEGGGQVVIEDGFVEYCNVLRERVLNNIGLSTCGEVIESIMEETKSERSLHRSLERESGALSHLKRGFKTFLRIDSSREKALVEEERCVLRYFEAKEMFTEIAGLEDLPSELYLMRYVLPSLTPLMAEVVRLRPEDPVAALADKLFDYKRRTEI